jgi:hypothetical protein
MSLVQGGPDGILKMIESGMTEDVMIFQLFYEHDPVNKEKYSNIAAKGIRIVK